MIFFSRPLPVEYIFFFKVKSPARIFSPDTIFYCNNLYLDASPRVYVEAFKTRYVLASAYKLHLKCKRIKQDGCLKHMVLSVFSHGYL